MSLAKVSVYTLGITFGIIGAVALKVYQVVNRLRNSRLAETRCQEEVINNFYNCIVCQNVIHENDNTYTYGCRHVVHLRCKQQRCPQCSIL